MLSIDLKINGCLAVHIYGHNIGDFIGDAALPPGMCNYYYEVHKIGKGETVETGYVIHKRDEGLEKLTYLILTDYLNEERS
jgi:hypothetical protein